MQLWIPTLVCYCSHSRDVTTGEELLMQHCNSILVYVSPMKLSHFFKEKSIKLKPFPLNKYHCASKDICISLADIR